MRKKEKIVEIEINLFQKAKSEEEILKNFDIFMKVVKIANIKIGGFCFYKTYYTYKNEKRNKNKFLKKLDKASNTKIADKEIESFLNFFFTITEEGKRKLKEIINNNIIEEELKKNKNIFYFKSEKFKKINFFHEGKAGLDDIILDSFDIIYELEDETIHKISIERINKSNVDEKLNEIFDRDDNFKRKYGVIYDAIYYENCVFYYIEYATTNNIHFAILTSDELENIEDSENSFYISLLVERLKYLTSFFNEELESEDIEIEIHQQKEKSKKIEKRKASVVRSHTRHYKSGVVSKVKSHLRKGVNSDDSIKIIF